MLDHYLSAVSDRLGEVLGPDLVGGYLGGSLALGDFELPRSDVDLLVVCRRPLSEETSSRVIAKLRHEALSCPAQALDVVFCESRSTLRPAGKPRYELWLMTGANWNLEVARCGEDSDLLVDLAVCREHGRRLVDDAPAPEAVIGEVSRGSLVESLRWIAAWHLETIHHPLHDPLGHNAVLNACRAWCYAAEGVLSSKTAGGEWARSRSRFVELVDQALSLRRGERTARLKRDAVADFVGDVLGSPEFASDDRG